MPEGVVAARCECQRLERGLRKTGVGDQRRWLYKLLCAFRACANEGAQRECQRKRSGFHGLLVSRPSLRPMMEQRKVRAASRFPLTMVAWSSFMMRPRLV